MKETDSERVVMLYERFRDVCLVEKEVWTEIYMPRQVEKGLIMTNVQEKYEVQPDSIFRLFSHLTALVDCFLQFAWFMVLVMERALEKLPFAMVAIIFASSGSTPCFSISNASRFFREIGLNLIC